MVRIYSHPPLGGCGLKLDTLSNKTLCLSVIPHSGDAD